MTDNLTALFAYNRWADARLLDACRLVPPERYAAEIAPGWASLRSTVAHIAGGTDLWVRRFLGQPSDTFVPETELATPDDAARLLAKAHDGLDRMALELSPEQLAAPFTYKNIKGQTCTLPLWAALRHVVNHETYHRGQAATKLKRLGVEPPVTDLALWAIEQTPQPG
jgi:uncharacterized damage-inducible protein DinB